MSPHSMTATAARTPPLTPFLWARLSLQAASLRLPNGNVVQRDQTRLVLLALGQREHQTIVSDQLSTSRALPLTAEFIHSV